MIQRYHTYHPSSFISRCRVKHLFADPMQSVPANPFTVCDHVTYRRVDGLRDEDFVLADIGMNPINEDCVLAFFHIGRGMSINELIAAGLLKSLLELPLTPLIILQITGDCPVLNLSKARHIGGQKTILPD